MGFGTTLSAFLNTNLSFIGAGQEALISMKQLLLSLIFALVALTGLQAQTIWDGTADTSWYNETSTKFEISTAKQLAGLAELVNNGNDFSGKTILLTADIVLNDTSDWENWESSAPENTWTPIGNSNPFSGTFDGQGYDVSGIYINTYNGDCGLFSYNKGTIKNVGVTNSYIKGHSLVGGVCSDNDGTISNCHNSGTVSGNTFVGGVCGSNIGSISNCYNSGKVSGNSYVGGVCGQNYVTISNCYNSGNISGGDEIGGVCGRNPTGTISDCYNSGTISGKHNIGGVCGNFNGNTGTISDCYNSGAVSGTGTVGGVCGGIHFLVCPIYNCYYLQGTAAGGIEGRDVSGKAEVKTSEQFASGEVCWLLNEEQSEGAWRQKLDTDPYPVLDGPAVFKDGDIYYNEKTTAIEETNNEQASFVIVSENLTINIYDNGHEATVFNLAGIVVYHGSERIIPVHNPGIYMVRIGNEVQKTIVR